MLFFKKKKEEPKPQAAPAPAAPATQKEAAPAMKPGFEQHIGDLTIKAIKTAAKDTCLEASYQDKAILMDIINTAQSPIPDGTNAYMFANKLIVVTRWGGLNSSEKQTFKEGELVLAIHPYEFMQFSLCIAGGWEDVFFTLPHCITGLNEEDKPVDELIYIACDSKDPGFINIRTVELPKYVQNLLMKGNAACHKAFSLDDNEQKNGLVSMTEQQQANAVSVYGSVEVLNQFRWQICNYIYDLCYEATKDISHRAKGVDPENIKGGIYVYIGSDNTVTDMRQG